MWQNIILLSATLLLSGCLSRNKVSEQALTLFSNGDYTRLQTFSDSLKAIGYSGADRRYVDSLLDISRRIRYDFPLVADTVKNRLRRRGFVFDEALFNKWVQSGMLESLFYEGQLHFFKRSVSNFVLRQQRQQQSGNRGLIPDRFQYFLINQATAVMHSVKDSLAICCPVDFELTFSLVVDANAVPAGEAIRCWLPVPRRDLIRQQNVELLSTFPPQSIPIVDSLDHQALYLEAIAVRDSATRFEAKYRYRSYAQYFDPATMQPEPYDRRSALYQKYTREELPHIVFNDDVRQLAAQIPGDWQDPLEAVTNIYRWINDHVMWVGAVEYGIQDTIPSFVLRSRTGDCGMQTFLFMSLARFKGIPVRWQSGWMLHPGEENLHDWCEVYYEGVGWVPVDVSFNLLQDEYARNFYITGIDAYRLVVNHGVAGSFAPLKVHFRSEPYDFQRGEVEWRGGNIYFNQWRYHLDVSVLE